MTIRLFALVHNGRGRAGAFESALAGSHLGTVRAVVGTDFMTMLLAVRWSRLVLALARVDDVTACEAEPDQVERAA